MALPDRARVRRILDLGTGTGCLLLAALTEFPSAFGVGVDRAERAANLARANAKRLGLDERAAFVCGDWDDPLAGRFDLVLSSPPVHRVGCDRGADAGGGTPRAAERIGRRGGRTGWRPNRRIISSAEGTAGSRRHFRFGGWRGAGFRLSWHWQRLRGSPLPCVRTSLELPGRWFCATICLEKTIWQKAPWGESSIHCKGWPLSGRVPVPLYGTRLIKARQ